jgi:hypothetical protein
MILASVLFGSAQENFRGTDYGFTYEAKVTNNYTFTNNNAYPFTISSMSFNSDVANTTTVTRIRPSSEYQVVGWVVSTNAFDDVVTNYNAQVTNTVTMYATNVLMSVTNAGDTIYDTSDIPQAYFIPGDIIKWDFSDNTSKMLYFDARR